jgi:hypothetical protein
MRSFFAGATVAAFYAVAAMSGVSPATAAGTSPGPVAVLPSTGTDQTALTIVTGAACPAGTNILAKITGSGFLKDGQNIVANSPITAYASTRTGGLIIPISLVLRDIGNLPADPVRFSGTYRITVLCRDRVRLPTLGLFVGSLTFTGPHNYRTKNPAIPAAAVPRDVPVPGSSAAAPGPQSAGGVGDSPSPDAASGVPAGGDGLRDLAPSSSAASPWLRWTGLLVLAAGAAGLVASARTLRRRSRPARS